MIQFKRGRASSWFTQTKPLADGQPGYDKDRKKLKIGDGETAWNLLPDASGLRAEEILASEAEAKTRAAAQAAFNPLGALINGIFNKEDRTIITYGTDFPSKETVGQVYLQHYEAEPETEYIVSSGKQGIWDYQVWSSGKARCTGTLTFESNLAEVLDKSGLFTHDDSKSIGANYPFTFLSTPHEHASVQSTSPALVWLGNYSRNTASKTGAYKVISPNTQANKKYYVVFDVCGQIDVKAWLQRD